MAGSIRVRRATHEARRRDELELVGLLVGVLLVLLVLSVASALWPTVL